MKKLVSICFACMLLMCAAGAANIGTIDNSYPGDTEAQAQMLYDLGLFRGTENGFELEKPMTRAEAAAMLTRFLGAEQEALAGEWEHPFTDVPQWADPYIGWLYENGLTKGVSETRYGAQENVTCWQYNTFLRRAISDNPDWGHVLHKADIAACDAAGFVRGDAVSVSARALSTAYSKGQTVVLDFPSLAHHMIDSGVFTTEQFRTAAWDVLPRSYVRANQYGTLYTGDGKLSCVIAGVRVLLDEDSEVIPDRDWIYYTGRLYGWLHVGDDQMVVYRIDENTLDVTELFSSDMNTTLFCTNGGRDYFEVDHQLVIVDRDDTVRWVNITFDSRRGCAPVPCDDNGSVLAFPSEQGVYAVDAAGLRQLSTQPANRLDMVDGLLVTQNIDAAQTTVAALDRDGTPKGSYTVANPAPPEMYDDLILQAEVEPAAGGHLYGTAGLYRVENGILVQITDRPVYDCEVDPSDNSYVIVTHEPGRLIRADQCGHVINRTGDMLVRIGSDGSETLLLPALPEGSLLLGKIEQLEKDTVRLTEYWPTTEGSLREYSCICENGRLRVERALPSDWMPWEEDAVPREQARLDALGIGVNASSAHSSARISSDR